MFAQQISTHTRWTETTNVLQSQTIQSLHKHIGSSSLQLTLQGIYIVWVQLADIQPVAEKRS